ncbi:cyclic nucleotide-binding protein [Desulforamulus reducens MI-1]|uniref:Cyclic nucleotide-binding protein n=1 Tax=Desulforamulus reducens (strain ATCC BAA-1160 / DSM 100696 / MI-1) TaxID=349161 RepID=A4J9I1_DESRM|nr:Crp/Fnr family transcriptional regulator [Desulforamulus reducens]ABO51734.1 cyclic nucleotide-binding protein [Desulforamulus reducens MI-1]
MTSKIVQLFPKSKIEEWLSHGKEINFKRGNYITGADKLTNDIYLIKKGEARLFHIHEDGKECILGLLSAGDFIDLIDIFTKKRSGAFSKALTEVTVIAVPKAEVRKVIEENPPLAMSLLSYLSERLQETVEILEQVAYGKVEERLLFLLKKIADTNQEDNGWYPIPAAITHQDLAGMVASSRETVTLLINKLALFGIIRLHKSKIWVKLESN